MALRSIASRTTRSGSETLTELRRALTRASLVFGSLAIVMVMAFGVTSGERLARFADMPPAIDDFVTGSIAPGERYVVSRSVLQPSGAGACIQFADGTRRGFC